jgi:glycine cleavage system H protein
MGDEKETNVPPELQYTDSHEWIAMDSDVATVGVTDFAQSQLGDIVFVELPEVGEYLQRGQIFGTIEAVKAVEELNAAVSGEVVEINESLDGAADRVNLDPYGAGWMIKIRIESNDELQNLLSAKDYEELIADA